MRALVLLLVLANFGLFGLHYRDLTKGRLESDFEMPEGARTLQRYGASSLSGQSNKPQPGSLIHILQTQARFDDNRPCWLAGPVNEVSLAKAALAEIEREGKAGRIIVRATQEVIGDWIYLSPLPSREAAQREASRLRNLGVRDLYVVVTNSHKNAISLGLFSQSSGTRKRIATLKQLGLKPKVERKTRILRKFWLLQQADAEPLMTALEKGFGEKMQKVDCEMDSVSLE